MLTCRRATERLSHALDGPLPPTDRVAMHAHLVLCPPCRRFRRQLQFLDAACGELAAHPDPAGEDGHLSGAARDRITTALEADR